MCSFISQEAALCCVMISQSQRRSMVTDAMVMMGLDFNGERYH